MLVYIYVYILKCVYLGTKLFIQVSLLFFLCWNLDGKRNILY